MIHSDNGDGIVTIDTGQERPRFAACYLVESDGRAAIFDCGTNYTVPRILQTLADRGLRPADVDYLIASHVHLDHSGGAGALLRELPNARVLAHARGVRHLVDPTALQGSAEQVYGADVVEATYGSLVGVPSERIRAVADEETIDLNGRPLRFIDAPGHARHHVVMHDERSRSWFSGDAFGIRYRDFDGGSEDFIFPTTSPVQFDAEAMKATIRRMLAARPRRIYLTHYDGVDDPARTGDALLRLIDAQWALARECHRRSQPVELLVEAIQQLLLAEVRRLGCPVDEATARGLLAIDAELNAKGMLIVLDKAAG